VNPTSELSAHRQLLTAQNFAWLVPIYEDDRPLRGFAQILDWEFQGAITQTLQWNRVSGKMKEWVYLPQSHPRGTFHLFIIGAGARPKFTSPQPTAQELHDNTLTLKKVLDHAARQLSGMTPLLSKTSLALVKSDWAGVNSKEIREKFAKIPLVILNS
jgi:hypothetical protein